MDKRCAIIGAGACGLPAARWALLYGINPVVFEASNDIGGIWRYRENETSVMKSTIINTSKEMTSFSDFPPDENLPNYMHHTKMMKYLRDYTDNYGLLQYIKFNHKVKNIKRAETYNETGQWIVEYFDENKKQKEELFDTVIISSGHNSIPHVVEWPNQNAFKGNILHASQYKKPLPQFEDAVNVVVGIGNSALDIAVEISRWSKQTYLATRGGAYVYKRVGDGGLPNDLSYNTRFQTYVLPKIIPSWIRDQLKINSLQSVFDHDKYGLTPRHYIYAKHGSLNDEIPGRIISGTLLVTSMIKEFTETGIIFDDGTKIEPVDNVILATGYLFKRYLFNLDIIEEGTLVKVENNFTPMYKYIYPQNLLDHKTLGIVGLIQPTGAIINTAEMQARFFFHVLTQQPSLPSQKEIANEIENKEKFLSQYFKLHLQRFWVHYIQYMDELADMIGCKPSPSDYALTDPKLAYALFFKPNASYVYRLKGTHQWKGARDAILNMGFRIDKPLRIRNPGVIRVDAFQNIKISLGFISVIMVAILFYYIFSALF